LLERMFDRTHVRGRKFVRSNGRSRNSLRKLLGKNREKTSTFSSNARIFVIEGEKDSLRTEGNTVAVKSIVSEFVNETDESSARFYLAKLAESGVNPDELTFVELVAVTRKWHGEWQRSDARRDERDAIAEAREAERKAERLANLAKKRDSLVAAAKRDAERAAKREAALAELAEAGLLDS